MAATVPSPNEREDRWMAVFRRAWYVVEKDVDPGSGRMVGGEARMDESEAKRAISCLDNELEAFAHAVRQEDIDLRSNEKLLTVFCKVANHRNATPLVRDWVVSLWDDYHRRETGEIGSSLRMLVNRLPKPQSLEAEYELSASILENLPQNMEAVSKDRLRCVLHLVIYSEREAWLAGKTQIPKAERGMLSQRLLDDVRYVEKEAFNIQRGQNDSLYIDMNTTADERLRRVCARIVKMWEMWYPRASESSLADSQKRRRWQPRRETEAKNAPSLPKPRPDRLRKWLCSVLVNTAAFVAESTVSQFILEHFPRRFIKSLETAPVDGALLLEDFFDPSETSLARHDRLRRSSERPRFLYIEIKNLLGHRRKRRKEGQTQFVWMAVFRRDTREDGISILTSAADPDRVVVCPTNGLLQMVDRSGEGNLRCMGFALTETRPARSVPPGFPSELQPYEIPLCDLGDALMALSECARNKTKVWRSVATNLDFGAWEVQASTDRNRLAANNLSEKRVRQLFTRFRDKGSKYEFRVNALAPLFGDGHFFRKEDGQQHFVELKEGLSDVFPKYVRHVCAIPAQQRQLFSWRQLRDWLLSIPSSRGRASALLIPWGELPEQWTECSYTGVTSAQASMGPPDNIRRYLLRWPGATGLDPGGSWESFCAQVEDRLDRTAPTRPAPTANFLRTLHGDVISAAIGEGDEGDEDDEPESDPREYDADNETQVAFAHKSASALHRILVKRYEQYVPGPGSSTDILSGKGAVVDAGLRCKISRYFVCRRHLPPSALKHEAAYANITRLTGKALLMPVEFIRLKPASTSTKKSARSYDLEGWGPGLLVCDSWEPDDLDMAHGRLVVDSRDFPPSIGVHANLNPKPPMVWEHCVTNEVEGDERNIVTRILEIFQPDGERQPPIVHAAAVFRDMLTSSRYS